MNSDRLKILDMLEKGTISAADAKELLEAVEQGSTRAPLTPEQSRLIKGKKLRIEVKGDTTDSRDMTVNVSVPLVLARHAENIIANCVPNAVSDELKQQGINLDSIKLGLMVDALEDLDEDIVNAKIKDDKNDLTVRVYVE